MIYQQTKTGKELTDIQTDRQRHNKTAKQAQNTDKQKDRQTERQIDRKLDRYTDKQIDRQPWGQTFIGNRQME